MSITSDVQKLDPGALVELFEVDATELGGDRLFFHAMTKVGSVWWRGNEYHPWPVQAEGFARDSDRPPTPTLRVANLEGSISVLCDVHDDLVGARVIRRRTFAKYLDARNFDEGNPSADPNQELPPESWFIERKVAETPESVEFELASVLDFNGVQLPRRQIVANMCPWAYRSADCGYMGPPVADLRDNPTSDPSQDMCGKRYASCKLRFPGDVEMPFGGFPAASLMRM